jgi:hypothetical protein
MKNNLAKILAVGTLVIGGGLLATVPAQAVQIKLKDGDTFDINTYGAKYTGANLGGNGLVITKAEFDNNPSPFANTFAAPGTFATADLINTNIPAIISNFPTGTGVAKIKSADFLNPAWFTPSLPVDVTFDPGVSNTFTVNPAFGNFIELDIADAETPDLAVRLLTIKTTQASSLDNPNASIGVGFEGDVEFITFGPGGEEKVLGTGSFSSTIPTGGNPSANGTAVLSFEVEQKTPEPSALAGLVAVGLIATKLNGRKSASKA